ncbi:MAG: LysR family transcriptional regulator [Rhodospirillaceae bacterium]|nr:LysR family transcriptional regulator [Rhodospirillaceae bacterium]
MEFRQLRHFVAVVECGNLSRASRKVHLSQPALTRSIKSLEDMLRARLLDRKPRGVVPTPAGALFYQHAKLILNECQRAREDVAGVESGAMGQVNIGIGAMFAAAIMDDVVAQVTEKHPKLQLSVTEGFFEDLVEQMRDGRIDALFTNFPVSSTANDLSLEPLLTVTAVTAISARHPLARKRNLTPTDLLDARWVVVNQPHVSESYAHLFAKDGLPLPVTTTRTNSLSLIKSLVQHHGFISFLPIHLIAPELKRGELVLLKLPGGRIDRPAGLILRNAVPVRAALGVVLAEIRARCAGEQQLHMALDPSRPRRGYASRA